MQIDTAYPFTREESKHTTHKEGRQHDDLNTTATLLLALGCDVNGENKVLTIIKCYKSFPNQESRRKGGEFVKRA